MHVQSVALMLHNTGFICDRPCKALLAVNVTGIAMQQSHD